jgi:hypothetical protein
VQFYEIMFDKITDKPWVMHSAEMGVSYSAIWQKKIMQLRKSGR